jgi:hypothetical protein
MQVTAICFLAHLMVLQLKHQIILNYGRKEKFFIRLTGKILIVIIKRVVFKILLIILTFYFVKAQQIKIIYEGMDTIERQTKNFDGTKCIQFLKRDKQTNFINIVNGQGCFSYVGKFVEKQSQLMSLNENKCLTKKTVAHELMHALGFQHEQVR